MPTWAEGNHQGQYGTSWYAVMHDDGALAAPWSVAHAATVLITFQHRLTQAGEVLIILPAQGVARGAHSESEDLIPPAAAVQQSLHSCLHGHSRLQIYEAFARPMLLPEHFGSHHVFKPESNISFDPCDLPLLRARRVEG